MTTSIANFTDTATGWQRAFYAFLAEKEQRSGSRRTVEGYSRMLQDFFGRSGKQPDTVTPQDIFVYAHGPGLSGKQPSPSVPALPVSVPSFVSSSGWILYNPTLATSYKGHRSRLRRPEDFRVTRYINS